MRFIDSMETYKAPQAKVMDIMVQSVLCMSNGDTEKFSMSGNSYDDNDWE